MYYNICYDIIALLLLFGIALSTLIVKDKASTSTTAFKSSILLLAAATVFDILSALTGADILFDSDDLNLLFETVYMCLDLYSLYAIFVAISSRISKNYRKQSQIIFIFVSIYTFLLLLNLPTHFVFSVKDGIYDNERFLYYVAYSIPILVMIHIVIVLVRNRNVIGEKIYVTVLIATCMPIAGTIIQYIFNRILVIQFCIAITLFVLNFIWETPDAEKLVKTVNDLEQARKSEASSRYEIEMADRAKSRFLSNISEELLQPISDIQEYAGQIIESNPDNEVGIDADEIIKAGNQFKELLNKLSD